jgi:hypothetical protein
MAIARWSSEVQPFEVVSCNGSWSHGWHLSIDTKDGRQVKLTDRDVPMNENCNENLESRVAQVCPRKGTILSKERWTFNYRINGHEVPWPLKLSPPLTMSFGGIFFLLGCWLFAKQVKPRGQDPNRR